VESYQIGAPQKDFQMAIFITRIELNGSATWQDYENLHKAMKRAGFSRLIMGGNGKAYHLPTAQYSRQANLNVAEVRDQAYAVACSVWSEVQTLTTEGQSAWIGLREASSSEIAAA
jgi:hypothetical protein